MFVYFLCIPLLCTPSEKKGHIILLVSVCRYFRLPVNRMVSDDYLDNYLSQNVHSSYIYVVMPFLPCLLYCARDCFTLLMFSEVSCTSIYFSFFNLFTIIGYCSEMWLFIFTAEICADLFITRDKAVADTTFETYIILYIIIIFNRQFRHCQS